MTYSPAGVQVPPMVRNNGEWSMLPFGTRVTAASSSTFESANRAVYFPLLVPTTCVARRLWWTNGVTVSASYNVDVGIYLDAGYTPGAKLVSTGSTAQGTASEVQFVDITDTTLAPGLYWLAIVCSSSSATFFRAALASSIYVVNKFEESAAMPLPATATPAKPSSNNAYFFGFATTASP